MVPALLLAFGGGIVSFASPCVLPLVPVYLSVVTGLDLAAAGGGRATAVVRDTALFVVGFTVVFVLLGTTASAVGAVLLTAHPTAVRLAGAFIIALAVFLAGGQLLAAPRLYRSWGYQLRLRRWRPLAAPAVGAAFGFGWTPCVGPVLASILTVAATRGQVAQGAALLAAYSLGLGVPFLAGGLLLRRLSRPLAWLRRRLRAVTLASAALMAALGVLVLTGQLTVLDWAGTLR
jgi:cytochrome c-type biogenesis protein